MIIFNNLKLNCNDIFVIFLCYSFSLCVLQETEMDYNNLKDFILNNSEKHYD